MNHPCDGQTDRQTDGQTDGIAIAYARLADMSRAKSETDVKSVNVNDCLYCICLSNLVYISRLLLLQNSTYGNGNGNCEWWYNYFGYPVDDFN